MLEQMIVGFVRGSHGVTGEFKVESTSGEYAHIEVLKEVTLRRGNALKVCKVEYAEAAGSSLYMKLEGINSPEEVRKYNGWEIVVPRECAAPLDEDEWYIEDLKQCSLIYYGENIDGLAEDIRFDVSGKPRVVLIPFRKEYLGKIDVENQEIVLMHLWILE